MSARQQSGRNNKPRARGITVKERLAEVERLPESGKKDMRYFKTVIIFLLISLIPGCTAFVNFTDFEGESSTIALLSLDFSTGAAKTILPSGIVPYSYTITLSDGADPYVFNTSDSNPTYELAVGTWDITVEGKDSGGNIIVSGSEVGVVLTIGSTTSVPITLSVLSGGTGSIDVIIDWSAATSVTVSDVIAKLDDVEIDSPYLELTDTSVRYIEEKTSGSYMLIFYLDYELEDTLTVAIAEAVQVFGNLTSSATIYLDNSDFN